MKPLLRITSLGNLEMKNNAAATEPVSRQQVTDAVLNSLSMIGVDTQGPNH
jgi:hypothetical protein